MERARIECAAEGRLDGAAEAVEAGDGGERIRMSGERARDGAFDRLVGGRRPGAQRGARALLVVADAAQPRAARGRLRRRIAGLAEIDEPVAADDGGPARVDAQAQATGAER